MDELPEFDESIKTRYFEAIQKEWQAKNSTAIFERLTKTGDWWEKYNAYLNSNHWRMVSKLVRERDRVCQKCFLAAAAQAHHLSYTTYDKHGFSFPAECVGICASCHDSITEGRK